MLTDLGVEGAGQGVEKRDTCFMTGGFFFSYKKIPAL